MAFATNALQPIPNGSQQPEAPRGDLGGRSVQRIQQQSDGRVAAMAANFHAMQDRLARGVAPQQPLEAEPQGRARAVAVVGDKPKPASAKDRTVKQGPVRPAGEPMVSSAKQFKTLLRKGIVLGGLSLFKREMQGKELDAFQAFVKSPAFKNLPLQELLKAISSVAKEVTTTPETRNYEDFENCWEDRSLGEKMRDLMLEKRGDLRPDHFWSQAVTGYGSSQDWYS